jgi:hypothetical protein
VEVDPDERVDVIAGPEGIIAVAQSAATPTLPPPPTDDKRRP